MLEVSAADDATRTARAEVMFGADKADVGSIYLPAATPATTAAGNAPLDPGAVKLALTSYLNGELAELHGFIAQETRVYSAAEDASAIHRALQGIAGAAVADLDGDGLPELLVERLEALEGDATLLLVEVYEYDPTAGPRLASQLRFSTAAFASAYHTALTGLALGTGADGQYTINLATFVAMNEGNEGLRQYVYRDGALQCVASESYWTDYAWASWLTGEQVNGGAGVNETGDASAIGGGWPLAYDGPDPVEGDGRTVRAKVEDPYEEMEDYPGAEAAQWADYQAFWSEQGLLRNDVRPKGAGIYETFGEGFGIDGLFANADLQWVAQVDAVRTNAGEKIVTVEGVWPKKSLYTGMPQASNTTI